MLLLLHACSDVNTSSCSDVNMLLLLHAVMLILLHAVMLLTVHCSDALLWLFDVYVVLQCIVARLYL